MGKQYTPACKCRNQSLAFFHQLMRLPLVSNLQGFRFQNRVRYTPGGRNGASKWV